MILGLEVYILRLYSTYSGGLLMLTSLLYYTSGCGVLVYTMAVFRAHDLPPTHLLTIILDLYPRRCAW